MATITITPGQSFSSTQTVTSTNLNALGSPTAALTAASIGPADIADDAITAPAIADDAITTPAILDANVTFAKLTDVIDDNTMATATVTNLATSASIKAYIDSQTYVPNLVQAVKSDTGFFQHTASSPFVDIPGLEVSITPNSAGSKMLVNSDISASSSANVGSWFRFVRDGTAIGTGDVDNTTTPITFGNTNVNNNTATSSSGSFLDSPTSVVGTPIVYKIQCNSPASVDTFINRGRAGNSTAAYSRPISSLTVTEVPQ
tara:strand:- start:1260 stop:2039 length:780 start_codon:yes stop_codon:yes gene_type:complete